MGQRFSLITELRRREVFRSAGIYIVAAWVVVQVASLVFPAIDVPDVALRYVWQAAILLFPVALVVAWRYDITPTGIVRTRPAEPDTEFDPALRNTDYAILTSLVLVAGAIAWDLTDSISDSESGVAGPVPQDQAHPNSIAVLPLENLSSDPEQQYFVSGMQDALIAGLSKVAAFKVTSKTSTLRYASARESLPSIAAQLGVAKLIEGSVFRVDDRVRINIQLLDAVADQQLWSESFEEDVGDVMKLQNTVAHAIADQVEVELTPTEEQELQSSRPVNPAAFEAYLMGQYYVEQFTPEAMQKAGEYYLQAVQIDPEYALSYWGLSKLCNFQAQAGLITPDEAMARCYPPIERALALNPDLPEAHLGYATHLTWRRFDFASAEPAFESAVTLNPSYAEGHMFYAHYLTLMGRAEEGSEHMQIALRLDPFNPFVRGIYGAQLMMNGNYEKSIEVINTIMKNNPEYAFGHNVIWQAYHELGDYDNAMATVADYFRVTRDDAEGADAIEAAYADSDYSAANRRAAEVLVERSKSMHVTPISIASFYEFAGDADKAIDWYEVAVEQRDPDAPYLGVLVKSPAIRHHPRFIQLMRDMGHHYWADKYAQSRDPQNN